MYTNSNSNFNILKLLHRCNPVNMIAAITN